MVYAREHAGVRRELALNATGADAQLHVWPKLDGANVEPDTATATTGAVEISGNELLVDVDDTTTLDENLACTVTWVLDGATHHEQVVYDVVRTPLGLLVSLNQLQERRPDVTRILTRIGQMLDAAAPLLAEACAGIYAATARVELQDRLRLAARGLGAGRPALIFDRDRLMRGETALALAHVYEAIAKDPAAGTDDDSSQARKWRADYERAWTELGPLAVDADEDGVVDTDLQAPAAGIIRTVRG